MLTEWTIITGANMNSKINPCSMEHIKEYGEIYAKAFSGEPWNDAWKTEYAEIHVREILE